MARCLPSRMSHWDSRSRGVTSWSRAAHRKTGLDETGENSWGQAGAEKGHCIHPRIFWHVCRTLTMLCSTWQFMYCMGIKGEIFKPNSLSGNLVKLRINHEYPNSKRKWVRILYGGQTSVILSKRHEYFITTIYERQSEYLADVWSRNDIADFGW